jgi:hypothetical protein
VQERRHNEIRIRLRDRHRNQLSDLNQMIDVWLCRGSLAGLIGVSFGREPSGSEDFLNTFQMCVSTGLYHFSG